MATEPNKPQSQSLGVAIAIGAGIGTAFFAGSDNPVWIGLGAGLGVLVWSLWTARRSSA